MKFKKVLIIFISIILLGTLKVKAVDSITTSYDNQGQYKFTENIRNEQLHTDVFYRHDLGETKTTIDKTPSGGDKNAAGSGGGGILDPNLFYKQSINILEGKTGNNVKVVNWGYTTESKYVLKNLTNLALDYEEKHPGWKVIGGVNTDFFDMSAREALPYQPLGPMISDGEVIRAAGASKFSLMIGFKNQGLSDDLVVKKYIANASGFDDVVGPFELSIYDANNQIIKTFVIDKHNSVPADGEISLYNANWDASKTIVPKEMDLAAKSYVIEKADKALANNSRDFYGMGTISSTTPMTLTEGQFAIISNNDEVNQYLNTGVKVRVQHRFEGIYDGIEELTSAHEIIYENNVEAPLVNDMYYYTRAPRSILGIKEDGTIVMVTIDGRQAKDDMYGATQEEMAAVMKYYDCVSAYNLDGGGSTTMLIREGDNFKVVNSPSDGNPRPVANAIFFVVYEPEIEHKVVDIKRNSVEIELDVNNLNGHDIKDLYVKLNGSIDKVTNKRIVFTNLEPNTEYLYQIYYKDQDGKLHQTILGGKVTTAKRRALVENFILTQSDNELKVEVFFNDPDQSITRASVRIGDQTSYINNSKATIKGVDLKKNYELKLIIRVDLGDGQGSYELTFNNPKSRVCNYVDIVLFENNRMVQNILK